MSSARISKNDYQIGIITALAIERAAITAMLDVKHDRPDDFKQASHDSNNYTWGRMGVHNVVIASLGSGVYGTTSATTTAKDMLWSFQGIKFGLMCGIGAGVPNYRDNRRDIRLGDVVVSQPHGISGGVFQYDLGKARHKQWERKDLLSKPPDVFLKALNALQTEHEFDSPQAHRYLEAAIAKHAHWGKQYGHPVGMDDQLFPSDYLHRVESFGNTCSGCDPLKVISRIQRPSPSEFRIHYGVIASGNSLVKDAELRDWIATMEGDCLCIEMEAAGLMNNFPCLVIRGICDYADSHKNDAWQRYACATAASFAKEVLSFVPSAESQSPDSQRSNGSDVHRSRNPLNLIYEEIKSRSRETNETLLHPAVWEGDVDAAKILIESGANIEARNEYGKTPLFVAARGGRLHIVKLLIKHRASIDAATKDGETPLFAAAQYGRLDVVKLLIEHRACIDAATKDGETPLFAAAYWGHLDVVKLLVEHKASIDATTKDGKTPLFTAAQWGRLDVVKLLIEHRACIDAASKDGNTPLFVAALMGRLSIVDVLLLHGASSSLKFHGDAVLDVAKRNKHHEMVELIKTHDADQTSRQRSLQGLFRREKKD